VRLTGNHDEVMLTGHNDRVLCTPSSHDSIIYSKRSVSVDSTCRANGARLYDFDQSPPKAGFRLVDTTTLQGSGTNDDPYVKPCDNPSLEDCTVTFDDRWMPCCWGPGSVETVPAYRCPTDHPYLYAKKYVPWGTSVIDGVEIVQTSNPWAINVYIGDASSEHPNNASKGFATGTLSGPFSSGATNWTAFRNAYRVVLHCTSNSSHGWG
jgi:hypothetical protein